MTIDAVHSILRDFCGPDYAGHDGEIKLLSTLGPGAVLEEGTECYEASWGFVLEVTPQKRIYAAIPIDHVLALKTESGIHMLIRRGKAGVFVQLPLYIPESLFNRFDRYMKIRVMESMSGISGLDVHEYDALFHFVDVSRPGIALSTPLHEEEMRLSPDWQEA